jgi:hypothetical protein
MPLDLRIGALVLAVLLLLAALLGARIFGSALRTRGGIYFRIAAAVAGAALIVWAVASYSGSQRQPPPAVAATSALPLPPSAVDLVGAASSAVAACPLATAPSVPDGATASLKDMTTARTAFQAFDAATNSYLHCVDSAIDRIAKQFAAGASQDDLHSLQAFGARAHDTAIDQEQAVADQFNSQIRTYKAKHPKS